jgi:gamma-glutamyl-gamma-aminobutyrate hydrolase PuuD
MEDIPLPRVVVTASRPRPAIDPTILARKNALYADRVRHAGGEPVTLDPTSTAVERAAAFGAMDGLLLSGGADIDPARYGATVAGSRATEPDRDALEAEAFAAADARGLPILGICRGLQAINIFCGGTLLQHVDGHAGTGDGRSAASSHPLRLDPTSRLAAWLRDGQSGAAEGRALEVNTSHHQAIRPTDLAPGLVAVAWADSPVGELVEGFEASGERFVVGVQCHPERIESTPPEFAGVWRAFIDACRSTGSRPR